MDGVAGSYAPRVVPGALASAAVCRWDATMHGNVSMVPDGCVELMWLDGHGLLVCGPETRGWSALHLRPVQAAGVRLRPGVAQAVLGVPVAELTDHRVPLDLLPLPADLLRRVTEAISLRDPADRSAVLLHLLHHQLAAAEATSSTSFDTRVCRDIERSDGLSDLATSLGVTTRQLHRRCQASFGYGPATLRRILRFQRFLALHKHAPHTSLASLAAEAGYCDQAHLSRDAKLLSGFSPSELLGRPEADWHGEGHVIDV